jgi:hypothetical protein
MTGSLISKEEGSVSGQDIKDSERECPVFSEESESPLIGLGVVPIYSQSSHVSLSGFHYLFLQIFFYREFGAFQI